MKVRIAAVTILVVALAGCGGGMSPQPASPSPKAKPAKDPTVKVLFTYLSAEKDSESAQFVAEIKNPADQARVGVETTWKAYDSDGVIVGSFRTGRPPIPAHGSIIYSGGAGLSGIPASLKITISDKGSLRKTLPKPTVTVGNASFARGSVDAWEDAHTYEVSAVVTAHQAVDGDEVLVWAVLRDDAGKIIGTGWSDGPGISHNELPGLLKGEKGKLVFDVAVPEGVPASVDVFAGGPTGIAPTESTARRL